MERGTGMDKHFVWSVEQGIGRLSFNRPGQANTFCVASREDMCEAIAAMQDPGVRVVLITGNGKFFCAGGDIGEFLGHRDNPVPVIDELMQFSHRLIQQLAALPVPVISVVNGPLSGAGIAYALCADFVLASDAAKLRGGYCALGLTPDLGSSYYVARRAGVAKAKEIFMLNRTLSAQDCLGLGLFDHVHPAGLLAEQADALARELAAGPTAAFGRVKALCDQAQFQDLLSHLDMEHVAMLRSARGVDFQEGMAAFSERRSPHFAGR